MFGNIFSLQNTRKHIAFDQSGMIKVLPQAMQQLLFRSALYISLHREIRQVEYPLDSSMTSPCSCLLLAIIPTQD